MSNRLVSSSASFSGYSQEDVDRMNGLGFSRSKGWYWFIRRVETASGFSESLEHIDLPIGTKGWLLDNAKQAKSYLRKAMAGEAWQIDHAYRTAVEYATKAVAW